MIVIDRDELFLAGQNGETITVLVKSDNTVHMVTFNLDGQTGVMNQTAPQTSQLAFKLDQAAHDPSKLLLVFHFASSGGGGMYRVLVKGDKGGDPFGQVFKQGNLPATAAMYTFDVV
jgi:hypothetical protein